MYNRNIRKNRAIILILEILFILRKGLIYYINGESRERLYISLSIKKKIFEQAHDLSNHNNYHRCYNRLSYILFIRYLSKNLRSYIIHYPKY